MAKSKQKETSKKKKVKTHKIPYSFKPEKMTLDEWQIALRKQFAADQKFKLENIGNHPVFSDFSVYNAETKGTYKTSIRDERMGYNFCSCPDFKTNNLGTCKHIEYVLLKLLKSRANKQIFKQEYSPDYSSVSLFYGKERKVLLRVGKINSKKIHAMAADFFDTDSFIKPSAFTHFESFIEQATKLDSDFRCYSDAIDFIITERDRLKRESIINSKYGVNPVKSLERIINAKLYPYQLDGILFAAKAGRCIIADEMGLGKTIQAIGTVELMAKEFGVEKVLIVCPTSLKYQWKSEIKKFASKDSQVIEGMVHKRHGAYQTNSFYKIISYNVVKNDIHAINNYAPDLIILDEAQRIKNWKTQTARTIKQLSSQYTIVLTGTPIENKLDELHSIIQFIDIYKLGALFRFLHQHQINDASGKVIGYTKLHEINKTLQSILIRRNKKEIQYQLPERIDKNYFVPVTEEQLTMHNDYYDLVSRLVHKWRKMKFLSEQDRNKLLIALNCMRMVCDSTYILDQKTRHDTKINELMIVLDELFQNKEEKVVIFSQWERMTRLVAQELDQLEIGYENLHGGIPSHKRKDLLDNFHNNPESRVFLSTDAGSTGLNLQCAGTIINLDIPWNPAILEQRIARIHRLGQKNCVRVINFISAGTIEERILGLLGFKKSVFEGVLDQGDNEVLMGEDRFKQFMRSVEEITEAPIETGESVLCTEESSGEKEINTTTKEKIVVDLINEKEATPNENNALPKNNSTTDEIPAMQNIHELISAGVDFLNQLSQSFSENNSNPDKTNRFIEVDKQTGKPILKIPLPDKQVMNKAIDTITMFLQALKKS